MQREAVLHVNCLPSCSWPHTNSVSLFPDVMHYLNYVRSLKEEYCLFVKIFCYFSLSVNENWNGYFGFLQLTKGRSEKWIYKVSWVVELIQWFPDTRRKSLVSFSLTFFNYILALNPFSYLLQAMFILLLCLATALGCLSCINSPEWGKNQTFLSGLAFWAFSELEIFWSHSETSTLTGTWSWRGWKGGKWGSSLSVVGSHLGQTMLPGRILPSVFGYIT